MESQYQVSGFTVGKDTLPESTRTAEAIELMRDAFDMVEGTNRSLKFTGEVLKDTSDPSLFHMLSFTGIITSICLDEPPSFTIQIQEAWQQIAECDCPYIDTDIFENPELAMQEIELSMELDTFAGAETVDPHFQDLPELFGNTASIRYDRLGWYGVHGH